VTTPSATRELQRAEARLVRRYRTWLDPVGTRLRGVVIPTTEAPLRADLFDTHLDLLIEAKAAVTREHIRYGIGQLLDYRRHMTPRPAMALLVPTRLPPQLVGLPPEAGVDVIWEEAGEFVDSRDGFLTHRF
jgi:hypothetical protein